MFLTFSLPLLVWPMPNLRLGTIGHFGLLKTLSQPPIHHTRRCATSDSTFLSMSAMCSDSGTEHAKATRRGQAHLCNCDADEKLFGFPLLVNSAAAPGAGGCLFLRPSRSNAGQCFNALMSGKPVSTSFGVSGSHHLYASFISAHKTVFF